MYSQFYRKDCNICPFSHSMHIQGPSTHILLIIACFQTVKDQVQVCKLQEWQLLIQIVIKCRPSFTKSPSLVHIDPIVSKIQPFENVKIQKEMYGHPDAVRHSIHMAIRFFVNFDVFRSLYIRISVKTSLINTKLGDFVKISVCSF